MSSTVQKQSIDNTFQRIIDRELPANILYEDKRVIAFYDIEPKSIGHFLVVPKTYSRNLLSITDADFSYLMKKSHQLALQEIAKMNVKGFTLQVNNEKESGQEIFHTHVHIIPSPK